jgi:hypothetical protein
MTDIGKAIRKATSAPGVPKARHVAERTVAPYLRADLHQLHLDHAATVERLLQLEVKVELLHHALGEYADRLGSIERHQPALLNALASMNGTARVLSRRVDDLEHGAEARAAAVSAEFERGIEARAAAVSAEFERGIEARAAAVSAELGARIDATDHKATTTDTKLWEAWESFQRGDDAIRSEIRPHIDTIGWLLRRVETVRAEMLHELRYGAKPSERVTDAKVVNPAAVVGDTLRLNIGAGHIALEGFVNVDIRELPGIDVVAAVDALPFEPGTLDEIFSSHTIEHFPEEQLRRSLLPYWYSLLKPSGVFRAVVPDLDAMARAYVAGEIGFESLRSVAYGGQEYEADFHYTGFTPDSFATLLGDAGFVDIAVVASGRPNGDCLECEVRAARPGS